MTSNYVWIGITVGVFFVGLAIGYMVFLAAYQPQTMMTQNQLLQQMMMQSPQHQQQMMDQMWKNHPNLREQMMESVAENPQQMRQWMQDTKHIEEMSEVMRENHDFMTEMMQVIIEDPTMRLHMIGHMTENQEARDLMMIMMGNMSSKMHKDEGMMHP